jgi:hypothetical protein
LPKPLTKCEQISAPPDLSEEDKTEWLRGFDDTRKYVFQNPQSELYDRGFSAGLDFREDFFG